MNAYLACVAGLALTALACVVYLVRLDARERHALAEADRVRDAGTPGRADLRNRLPERPVRLVRSTPARVAVGASDRPRADVEHDDLASYSEFTGRDLT